MRAPPAFSLSNSLKTSPHSPLSTTLALPQRHEDLDEVEGLSFAGVDEAVVTNVEEGVLSSELVAVEVSKTIMTTVEGGVAEAVGLAGRTMINHNGIGILPSTSSLIGRCWKRLTSTAWPNST